MTRLIRFIRLYFLRRACLAVYRCEESLLEASVIMAEVHANGDMTDEAYDEWERSMPRVLDSIEEYRQDVLDRAARLGAVRAAMCWVEGKEPA